MFHNSFVVYAMPRPDGPLCVILGWTLHIFFIRHGLSLVYMQFARYFHIIYIFAQLLHILLMQLTGLTYVSVVLTFPHVYETPRYS